MRAIFTTMLGLTVGIWMGLVLYIGFNMLDKLDYIAESSDYEIQLLDLIYGELEPVGQLGLISHYARDYPDLPYLVKLNSKSHIVGTGQRDPISQALWDMDDVMSLVHNGINVVGIGYTIYIGSEF